MDRATSDTKNVVSGTVRIDLDIVKREDLEKVIDNQLKFFRKDLLAACLKRLG